MTELANLVADFNGDVGVYVRRTPDDEEIAIHAEELFPTASLWLQELPYAKYGWGQTNLEPDWPYAPPEGCEQWWSGE